MEILLVIQVLKSKQCLEFVVKIEMKMDNRLLYR